MSSPRVLGVSYVDASDWREELPQGKWSQFFGAIGKRLDVVDVIRPEISERQRYLNFARNFRPRKSAWKARAGFNRHIATTWTREVQSGLDSYAGSMDLIVQLQTMFAPGLDRRGVPYAIYTDNTWALTKRFYADAARRAADGSWRLEFEAEICRSASAVFTFSEYARSSIISDYGCAENSVHAIGAGANQLLDVLDERVPSSPKALFVGIEFERKGGLVLLEAWRTVRESVPDAELLIAGPSDAPSSGVPAGVQWLGRVDRNRLSELYREASVFVLPSLYDPCPFVFFEAMGHGLACVGTFCCAIPELVDDGSTGHLVPSYEPEPLAAALIDLLTDPSKAAEMGRAGHAKVRAGNTWSDVADRFVSKLDEHALAHAG